MNTAITHLIPNHSVEEAASEQGSIFILTHEEGIYIATLSTSHASLLPLGVNKSGNKNTGNVRKRGPVSHVKIENCKGGDGGGGGGGRPSACRVCCGYFMTPACTRLASQTAFFFFFFLPTLPPPPPPPH